MSENETSPKSYKRPVIVAGATLALGGLTSLAFNIKAIMLDHEAAEAAGRTPDTSAMVVGILAPLFLAMAIELLQHTPWRASGAGAGWVKNPDTWVRAAVLILVAGVAAWISYWHGVHVLDHWGYDEVAHRVGPVVPDAAMVLATLALHRIGQAVRAAKALANTAGQVATALVATGQTAPLANPVTVAMATARTAWEATAGHRALLPIVPATDPIPAEVPLAEDWSTLESDLDRDLEAMINASRTEAPSNAPASPAPTTEGQAAPATANLTTVPQAAADAILAALQADPKAPATVLAADLVTAGLASSDRTGRRYVAAVKNGTARVS